MREIERKYSIKRKKLVKTTTFSVALFIAAALIFSSASASVNQVNSTNVNVKGQTTKILLSTARDNLPGVEGIAQAQPAPLQPTDWIHYDDGTNVNSIGLTAGGTFEYGARFTPTELTGYDGWDLTTVKHHHGWESSSAPSVSGYVRIYDEGTSSEPGTLLHEQAYTTGSVPGWEEYTLTSAVTIDDSKDIWVCLEVTHIAGEYPAGVGPGPMVSGKGGWIYLDPGPWQEIGDLGLDYNWNMWAGLEMTGVYEHDVGVQSINAPVSGPAGVITPEVTVKNSGNNTETTDVQLTIGHFALGTTFLTEDFSSWPPSGWTVVGSWYQGFTSSAGGTSPEATLYWSTATGLDSLTTPTVNTVAASTLELEFKIFIDDYSGGYDFHVWSRADGGDAWTDNAPWTNPIPGGNTGPGTYVVDISHDIGTATEVSFEFDGTPFNIDWIYLDDVEIREPGGVIGEYDETETVTVAVGESEDVTFDDWTPDAWQVEENVDITYEVMATTLLADDNPSNDQKTSSPVLNYPYLHDIEVTSINSPIARGPAQTLPVEVTIKNVGQFEECCYKTSVEIGEKAYTNPWQRYEWSGTGQWLRYPYGHHSYEPTDCGDGDYYAGTWYASGVTFETSLVTYGLDLTSAGSSATLELCRAFQDFAGYGDFEINVYSGGFDVHGPGSSYWETQLLWLTVDDIPRYGIYTILPFDPSVFADPSEVYIEFYYDDDNYGNAWGVGIDCVAIPEIGFYEGFEGDLFPPAEFVVLTEYSEDVCVIELDPGEEAVLEFPDWTPDALALGISGDRDYHITAEQELSTDTNPSNDIKEADVTLQFFHDVLVKEITDPSIGGRAPWDQLAVFDIGATGETGANGNAGAESDGTYLYSTRWAANLIHQYDMTGSLIKEFSVPGVTGLRDLAYNEDTGTFYGGAAGGTIWEMDFDSETLVNTLSGGFASRAIGYNPDDDVIYCSNWGDPVWVVDPSSGAILDQFDLVTTTSTYGFAYDNDGTNKFLYVFDQTAGAESTVYQWDLDAGAYTGFSYDMTPEVGSGAGIAGGLFITDGFDPNNLVIGGCVQDSSAPGVTDWIAIYELRPGDTSGGGYPPITVWVASGTQSIGAIVGNDGVFEETGLTCYGELLQYIDDPENGTLVWDDSATGIDLDPLGDEQTIPFGSVDFDMEGPWGLYINFPLGTDDYPNNNMEELGIGVDDTAPTSSHTLDPPTPDGLNGWYISDITVTLNGEDGTEDWQSGVEEMKYRIDGGAIQTIPGFLGTFLISQDGEDIEVEYWAIDSVGNEESPHNTFTVSMDQTPPDMDLTYEVVGGSALQGWEMVFTATCTDDTSGMERVDFFLNDVLQSSVPGVGPTYQWGFTYHGGLTITIKATGFDNAGLDASDEVVNPKNTQSVNQNSQQVTPTVKQVVVLTR